MEASKPAEEPEAEVATSEKAGAAATTALAPIRRENGTISGSHAIDRMIADAADQNNIPRDLAFGVVHVESTYNPRARGAGVYGLSQIMPATARSMGFSGSTEDLLDPATNLRYGMRYLAGAWEKGGRDVCGASVKYKGGHRATAMTRSASAYCGRVRQHMARIAGNPILRDAPVQLASSTAPVTVASSPIAATLTAARAEPVTVSAPTASESTTQVALAPAPRPAARESASGAIAAVRPAASAPPVDVAASSASAPAPAEIAAVPTPSGRDSRATAIAAESAMGFADTPDPARFGG